MNIEQKSNVSSLNTTVDMRHWTVIVAILSTAVSVWSILPTDPSMFDDHPELCKTIYSDMMSLRDASRIIPKAAVTERLKRKTRETKGDIYNFTFIYEHDPDKFLNVKLNLRLDPGQTVASLMPEGTLLNILPINYKLTWYSFTLEPNRNDDFILIEGKRCKFQYDRDLKTYREEVCWEKPSICRGWIDECIANDDIDHLCYDTVSKEGKRDSGCSSELYSSDLGEKLYWFTHSSYFIYDDGTYFSANRSLDIWDCQQDGFSVVCNKTDESFGYDGYGLDASLTDVVPESFQIKHL